MKVDLAGKIKETQLPRFQGPPTNIEAVVNSLQAIEDARPLTRVLSPTIEIVLNREAMLEGHEAEGKVTGFVITDNGVRFGPANLNSFLLSTPCIRQTEG